MLSLWSGGDTSCIRRCRRRNWGWWRARLRHFIDEGPTLIGRRPGAALLANLQRARDARRNQTSRPTRRTRRIPATRVVRNLGLRKEGGIVLVFVFTLTRHTTTFLSQSGFEVSDSEPLVLRLQHVERNVGDGLAYLHLHRVACALRTQPERILIVDGVSAREPIHIRPTRNPDRVLLRELTRPRIVVSRSALLPPTRGALLIQSTRELRHRLTGHWSDP